MLKSYQRVKRKLFSLLFIFSFLALSSISITASGFDSSQILSPIHGNNSAVTGLKTSATASMLTDNADGYTIGSTVNYQVDYIWDFDPSSFNTKEFWFARINNHSSPTFPGVPQIQDSELLVNTSNYDDFILPEYSYDPQDDYNNSYDYFKANLGGGTDNFQYNATYNVTIRAISWNINEESIGEYDEASPIYQNYTGAENMLEVDDPVLIALSDSICQAGNSIAENATAIFNWFQDENNFIYDIQDTELSAREAYDQGEGDCSEFSNLMVTLLRIQGIPARKLVGLLIVEPDGDQWNPIRSPVKGESWTYTVTYDGSTAEFNMPGHAWLEYYIPGYGWIQCDPTNRLLNQNDFTHLYITVGENFGGGIDPSLPSPTTELCLLPVYNSPGSEQFDLTMKVTVLDVNMVYDNELMLYLTIFIIVSLLIVVIYVVSKGRKSKT